jgi:spore germination cell wall hydrolase CwlJ-like protein
MALLLPEWFLRKLAPGSARELHEQLHLSSEREAEEEEAEPREDETGPWAGLRNSRRAPLMLLGVLVLIAAGVATASVSVDRSRKADVPVRTGSLTIPLTAPMPPRLPGAPSQIEAVEPVRAERAREANAALPFSTTPAIAARPFILAAASAPDEERAQLCLTQAIYYEAGYEPIEGRRAVAQVVLNRMRHPGFPKSVCGVVYDGSNAPGCQFSFTCDGSMRRIPSAAAWRAAAAIAADALAGHVVAAVGQATHYHTDWVAPYWAPSLTKIKQIGAHIFYRFPGRWGTVAAFSGRYAGREPALGGPAAETDPVRMALAQSSPERRAPNDVGGRLDTTKGWTLSIPGPDESRNSLAKIMSTQVVATPALAANIGGNGG